MQNNRTRESIQMSINISRYGGHVQLISCPRCVNDYEGNPFVKIIMKQINKLSMVTVADQLCLNCEKGEANERTAIKLTKKQLKISRSREDYLIKELESDDIDRQITAIKAIACERRTAMNVDLTALILKTNRIKEAYVGKLAEETKKDLEKVTCEAETAVRHLVKYMTYTDLDRRNM